MQQEPGRSGRNFVSVGVCRVLSSSWGGGGDQGREQTAWLLLRGRRTLFMPYDKTQSTDRVGGCGHAIPPHRGSARARAHSVPSRAALQLLGQQIGACQADTLDAYRLWHRAGSDTETDY